jgi:eukaryotic-like serine/threonine-protein kinase
MSVKTPLDSSRTIIPAGTQLNSMYEIDEPLATGGMGEVYRGHEIQAGHPVAIKLIRSDLNEEEAAFALFRKEADALRNLHHEAIVRYYVFTIDPTLERPYLAMEFVDGQSLSTILRKSVLTCEEVHCLMVRVASGLQAAHIQQIVHRDISPDNIIIPGGDMKKAKIIDFGIARSTRLDSGGTIIGTGFAGKYNYVSPEQLGLFGGDVTPKSDIYSLALVVAEALRQSPIDMGGNHATVIEKRRKVPDLSGIDTRLRPLLEQMLQPDPKDRPASMAEIAGWSLESSKTRTPNTTKTRNPNAAKTRNPSAAKTRTPAAQSQPVPRQNPAVPRQNGTIAKRRRDEEGAGFSLSAPMMGLIAACVIVASFGVYVLIPKDNDQKDKDKDKEKVTIVTKDPTIDKSVEGLTKFVAGFGGGESCMFVKPLKIADQSAFIEGYGVTRGPFDRLDGEFRDRAGFEAEIGVHEVAENQCPAVRLLHTLQNSHDVAPKIALSTSTLKADQNLSGTIEGIDGRQVDLLLVADDGSVRHVAGQPYAATNEKMPFNVKLSPDLANGKLQLLVAIASPRPLQIVQNRSPGGANEVFQRLVTDADRDGIKLVASLRSFKLDR